MPIYEYACEKCGDEFEELIFHDGDLVKCPACGSKKTRKLISKCRFKTGGAGSIAEKALSSSSKSGACASCTSGDCSTCGG